MTLWEGRFTCPSDEQMRHFNDSFSFDRRMYAADIQGSIAYARALARAGLITADERDQLVAGLAQVRNEFEDGRFLPKPGDEDIHTAVERRLSELVGPVAGKLHTGRSRNDQVTTDLRLYLLDETATLRQSLVQLQADIITKAEAHLDVIMPGYTHLQQAQPVLFSHWLMSFFWKFQRDYERLAEIQQRIAVLPLGSGAIAGNPFAIDRQSIAAELGFVSLAENSIDAVSDRDYVVEFLSWAALLQVHLSGLAEDLIIWSSHEFGFVHLDDAYATGSSLMPQKKNPDVLELIRGKTGRVVGHLMRMLIVLKGLPSGYNKDLQEDKEAIFDVLDTLILELPLVSAVIRTLKIDAMRMSSALNDALLATDLADYLVRKGIPFRTTHRLVAKLIQRAEALDLPLQELDLHEYQAVCPAFGDDVYAVFDFRRSVETRDTVGGTATATVLAQIERAKALLEKKTN